MKWLKSNVSFVLQVSYLCIYILKEIISGGVCVTLFLLYVWLLDSVELNQKPHKRNVDQKLFKYSWEEV